MKRSPENIKAFIKLGLIACFSAVLSGCKLELTVPEGGQVRSATGAYVCSEGQRCRIDVNDLAFDETFYAVPDPGYEFRGWLKKHRSFCGGKTDSCRLFTSGFAGTDLEMFLSRPEEVFYLEPIFHATTRQTIDGRYSLETTEMRLICSDGSQGTVPTIYSNFYAVEAGGKVILAPVISLMAPEITPLYETVFSGPLSQEGHFRAEKNIKAYFSSLDTVADLRYQLEGQVSGGGWSGAYSFALIAPALGARCDGLAQFSGIKHIPGADQSPEGIWFGELSLDGVYEQAAALITTDGEVRITVTDGQQILGSMAVNNDKFKASLLTYAPLGSSFQNGLTTDAGTASGTLVQGSTFYGFQSIYYKRCPVQFFGYRRIRSGIKPVGYFRELQ